MSLGIDFGTTRTVVAYADRGNYPVVSFESHTGDWVEWFPSVVAEHNGSLSFGFDALAVGEEPNARCVRSFKRLLAGAQASPGGGVTIGSVRITVRDLCERFLIALRVALQKRSNLPQAFVRQKPMHAVVAAPANAFCTQRFVTLDAFRGAGFTVLSMLNEPSAAGFEYSHRHARTLNSKREHVIVYDLGGGTFDASLVHLRGKRHEVVATSGLARLGGDDFDRVLAQMVAGESFEALGERERANLETECRGAKETLGPSSRKITIDGASAGLSEVTVAVADYFERCEPLVASTLEAMKPVLDRSAGAGFELTGVAGVYVVGGASSLPVVGRVLRDRFGKRVHRSPYAHASVAIGLAIAGDAGSGFELDDRFSRNFGVFREGRNGEQTTYDPLFTRDMPLPRSGQPTLSVERRYRAAHDVGHYRFFECTAFAEDGSPRGDLAPILDVRFPFDTRLRETPDLSRMPVSRIHGLGPQILERYDVGADGLVRLTITDLDSGYTRTCALGS